MARTATSGAHIHYYSPIFINMFIDVSTSATGGAYIPLTWIISLVWAGPMSWIISLVWAGPMTWTTPLVGWDGFVCIYADFIEFYIVLTGFLEECIPNSQPS